MFKGQLDVPIGSNHWEVLIRGRNAWSGHAHMWYTGEVALTSGRQGCYYQRLTTNTGGFFGFFNDPAFRWVTTFTKSRQSPTNDFASTNGDTDLATDTPYMVGAVNDLLTDRQEVYLDGESDGFDTAAWVRTTFATEAATFGHDIGGFQGNGRTDGMERVGVWDVALTDDDMQALGSGLWPHAFQYNDLIFFIGLKAKIAEK